MLAARFDLQALAPPAAAPAEHEAAQFTRDPESWQALCDWCRAASDSPLPAARLGMQAAGSAADLRAWADALARHLDGGSALDALPSGWPRLALRLRVKWQDLQAAWGAPAGRSAQVLGASVIWDAGWVRAEAAALDHLARRWQPRRPTLLLADAGAAADGGLALAQALDALRERLSAGGVAQALPLRWLWVGHEPAAAPAPAANRAIDSGTLPLRGFRVNIR